MAEFGDALVTRDENGSITVERADDIIGVTAELLVEADRWTFGPDGLFWLDPAGEYRYRPVRFAIDYPRVLVMERVKSNG